MGRLRKSGQKTGKRGSSEESCGEDTPHYKHLASASNMFSDWVREREQNMELDGGKMPVLTFSGSDASDNDKPPDQSEKHAVTRQRRSTRQWSRLSISRVLLITRLRCPATPSNKSTKTLRGNERQVSHYISKIVGPSTGKPWTPESSTLIMVNSRV